jgi:phosphonopyruvate decarboxylase
MIDPRDFVTALSTHGIGFSVGVPDSLLKQACAAITDLSPAGAHVIAANEGAAIGLAIGHHLATGDPALVYMQNSGLGNALNPLASLADPAIYAIPMLLMIGWRGEMAGEAQLKDEPQHVTQGRITLGQLDLLGIAYTIVDGARPIGDIIGCAATRARREQRPVALVVRKESFGPYSGSATPTTPAAIAREEAIAAVLDALPLDVPIVATTGMASRELFELRKARGQGHARDFLTVGGMGQAVSIATGIALARRDRKVVCLDGDGAMLMHLGALTEAAIQPNLIHLLLNNLAHDSVGGQPTAAARLDLTGIAAQCGYAAIRRAQDVAAIGDALREALAAEGSHFIELSCRRGSRPELGRPDRTPIENKRDFMTFLEKSEDGA